MIKPYFNLEKKLDLLIPSPIKKISLQGCEQNNLNIFIKRDDQIHAVVCGNKWRKLKYNLKHILENNTSQVVSFGGAWSNHLHALGYCCKQLEIELIAIIRGEESNTPSAMLIDLMDWGAKIKWISRSEYRLKTDPQWLQNLSNNYPNSILIPEGGSNALGMIGITELAKELMNQFPEGIDYVCTAVGSGGTIAGLIRGFQHTSTTVIGIPVVKGVDQLNRTIDKLLGNHELTRWQLMAGYECGGYAKYGEQLAQYIKHFKQQHDILLEPIYTAKLLSAVEDLIQKQFFKPDSTIVILHSGGLQGLRGTKKFNLNAMLSS